jgi:pyruvate formate lyase activating enzyme
MFARTPGRGVPTQLQSNAPSTFDSAGGHLVSWDRCTLAGNCVSSCPSDALKIYGSKREVPEIMEIVRRDKAYYANSGGGLTLSGGEPTSQIDFAEALLRAAKAEGIATCVETCGFGPRASFERLLDCCDLFLFDLKAGDDERHRELTGAPLAPILDNLRWLAQRGARLLLRCPLIPGVNDDEAHLRSIALLSRELPLVGVEVLPYHDSGLAKRERIGSRDPFVRPPVPGPSQIDAWRAFLLAEGCRGLL